jgi:hypothetical protein
MIKRTDKIYMEIEEFEEYELTSCVRYELARRAKGVFLTFYNNEKEKSISLDDELEYKVLTYLDAFDDFEDTLENRKILKQRILQEKEDDYKSTYKQGYKIFTEVHHGCNLDDDHLEPTEDEIRQGTIQSWDDLKEHYEGNEELLAKSVCNIQPNFKRKIIKPSWLMRVNAEIDLTLPENELVAYIKMLKRAYEDDNDIPKAVIEAVIPKLLLDDMRLWTPKNRACKWADMFFVYDAIKSSMKQWEIKSELDYYYDNFPDKQTKRSNGGIDPKTIKQYYRDVELQIAQIVKNKE